MGDIGQWAREVLNVNAVGTIHRRITDEWTFPSVDKRDVNTDEGDNDPEHAGFLIRCIEQLAPTRKVCSPMPSPLSNCLFFAQIIDGPCRVVDHILSLYGVPSLDTLVAYHNFVDPTLAAFPACTPPVSTRLQLIAVRLAMPATWREHALLVRSPRVGLTLKKLAEHPNQWQYLAQPYRFVSQWSVAAAPIADCTEATANDMATPTASDPAAAAALPVLSSAATPTAIPPASSSSSSSCSVVSTTATVPASATLLERWLATQPTAEALQAVFGPALLRHMADPAAALLCRSAGAARLLVPPPLPHPFQNGRALAVIGLRAWSHLDPAQIALWVAPTGRGGAGITSVVERFDACSRAAAAAAAVATATAVAGPDGEGDAKGDGAKKIRRRTDMDTADGLVAVLSECIGRKHT